MHVMCMCSILLLFISYLKLILTYAMHSFHILTSNDSAASANVIVTARMKMRGTVRGVANGSTEVAQGANAAQGQGGSCK